MPKTTTPTIRKVVVLTALYSDKKAIVRGELWPNGDVWISDDQLKAATKRAGLMDGDSFIHFGGSKREGYLVMADAGK